jgi:hypothetical protein
MAFTAKLSTPRILVANWMRPSLLFKLAEPSPPPASSLTRSLLSLLTDCAERTHHGHKFDGSKDWGEGGPIHLKFPLVLCLIKGYPILGCLDALDGVIQCQSHVFTEFLSRNVVA